LRINSSKQKTAVAESNSRRRHSTRQLLFASLGLASLLLAGCSNRNDSGGAMNAVGNDVVQTYYTVAAGPVTGNRASGINSSFRITEAANAATGIESDLSAGACIIFRAQDLGYSRMAQKTCHNDNQCNTGEGQGYCEIASKKCWARPIADPDPLCRRSLETHAPWPPDTDNMISNTSIPVPANLQPGAQAVTVACLRGSSDSPNDHSTLCGGPHSLVKWGQPTTLP